MRLFIILSCLLVTTYSGLAQITFTGKYVSNNSENFQAKFGLDQGDLRQGFELGLGYWFRLKNKRLEFIPEIGFSSLSTPEGLDATGLHLDLNVLIYPLDFHNDCNTCPTFSKEGGLIKKGFHWIIAPALFRMDVDGSALSEPILSPPSSEQFTSWRIGGGVGLDIGVTNLVTVTPIAMLYFGKPTTESLVPDIRSGYRQIHIGLRSTWRFDKDKW